MAAGARRRRPHPAASARILAAGLSSAAAFGMVAGMAVSAGRVQTASQLSQASGSAVAAAPPPDAGSTPPPTVVVIRRHFVPVPSGPGTPALLAAPAVPSAPVTPARPTPTVAPAIPAPPVVRPAPAPITRTRGS